MSYEEQIMFKDKYPSIFSPQMEAILFSIPQIFFATRAVLKIGKYLNNRVFLSRNYRLRVAPRKFDVLETNMLVLRTSNFQGATIRPIVPRHKHSIVFIVHH